MLLMKVDGSMHLTRGDSAELEVVIVNEVTGSEYAIQEEDTLVLSVKKSVNETDYVFQKSVVGTNLIRIDPTDTDGLPFARYIYDVQLTTGDGRVFTVVPPTILNITAEVTCSNGC